MIQNYTSIWGTSWVSDLLTRISVIINIGTPRSHLVSATRTCSLRTAVGPVTSNISYSAAAPGRQDQRKPWQCRHHLVDCQYWSCQRTDFDRWVKTVCIALLRLTPTTGSLGVFSMNCNVPSNGKLPEDPLYIFGAVVASAFVLVCIYLLFVRRLWRNAKKRTRKSVF